MKQNILTLTGLTAAFAIAAALGLRSLMDQPSATPAAATTPLPVQEAAGADAPAAALTPEQQAALGEARKAYESARAPECTPFWKAQDLAMAVYVLRNAGFDMEGETAYALLGTTKDEFRAEFLPLAVETAKTYYDWSKEQGREGQYASNCLAQLESIMMIAGYDLESEEACALIGTTKRDYDAHRKGHHIIAARDAFANAEKDGYIPDACMYNARAHLMRAKLDMNAEATYRLIGTTRAEFEARERKYAEPRESESVSYAPAITAPLPS